jgi:hypothetical protein
MAAGAPDRRQAPATEPAALRALLERLEGALARCEGAATRIEARIGESAALAAEARLVLAAMDRLLDGSDG